MSDRSEPVAIFRNFWYSFYGIMLRFRFRTILCLEVNRLTNSYHTHQKFLILNLIHALGPISRTKLIALSGYRPASVGSITKELLEEKLLIETGFYSSGHGRKRTLLEINREHICAIGVSFFSDSICIVLEKFSGEILYRSELPFSASALLPDLAAQIGGEIHTLIEKFPDRRIVGVGIGDPVYNQSRFGNQDISYLQFSAWIRNTLKPDLAQTLPIPVSCFSSVALPVLAERRFGAAKGCDHFLCIELSNGIGCSICCNGTVVTGFTGAAGELGHTIVNTDSDDFCYCGKTGCVEHAAAFPAIKAELLDALGKGVQSALDADTELTVSDIRRALDEGDQLCRSVVKRSAEKIGAAIANAVNILNPEKIILYGFLLDLGEYFLNHLTETVRENTIFLASGYEIELSPELESMLPLGAASEMFTLFLRAGDYAWVYDIRPDEADDEQCCDEM